MHRLVTFVFFIVINNAQAQEDWNLYFHIGGKGDVNRLSHECYSRSELMTAIPFTDLDSNFRFAADNNAEISSELIGLGNIGSIRFFDIHQHIEAGYYDYIKIIATEKEGNQLCPFFAQISSSGIIELTTSYFVDDLILVHKSRVSGTAGGYVEKYFYLENGVVQELEIDVVLDKAVGEVLLENPEYTLGIRAGNFSIEDKSYRVPIFRKGEECGACSIGTINLELDLKNSNIIVLSSAIELY